MSLGSGRAQSRLTNAGFTTSLHLSVPVSQQNQNLARSKEHRKQDNGLHHNSDGKLFWEESASEPGAVRGLEIQFGRNFGLRVLHWKMP